MGIYIVLLLLVIWNVALTVLYVTSVRFYRRLKDDKTGYSLHDILQNLLGKFVKNENKLKDLDTSFEKMKTSDLKNVSGVGLVRFNPFDDTGGDQSFALALLNKKNDGVVLSSLHGRSGTRIYAKV